MALGCNYRAVVYHLVLMAVILYSSTGRLRRTRAGLAEHCRPGGGHHRGGRAGRSAGVYGGATCNEAAAGADPGR